MKKITLLGVAAVATAIALAPSVAQTKSRPKNFSAQQELACLKANIFFEARGESSKGKAAIAKVTLNRVKSKKYPSSVCSVMVQPKQFSYTHQLPWSKIQRVMQGDLRGFNSLDKAAYLESKKIAEKGLKMRLNVLPDSVLYYHANYVKPKWARKMQVVSRIGKHIFLKEMKK